MRQELLSRPMDIWLKLLHCANNSRKQLYLMRSRPVLEEQVAVLPLTGKVLNQICGLWARRWELDLFEPGSHGSTFGGNPLACAVAVAALKVLEDEKLAEQSEHLGNYFMKRLRDIRSSAIKDIRGRGLFIGVELYGSARPYCERLMSAGLLCKETHETTIRFAPPLTIKESEIDWALERIELVLTTDEGADLHEK